MKRLKDLETENSRLRKGIADLTLNELILKEAASENWSAPRVGALSYAENRVTTTD